MLYIPIMIWSIQTFRFRYTTRVKERCVWEGWINNFFFNLSWCISLINPIVLWRKLMSIRAAVQQLRSILWLKIISWYFLCLLNKYSFYALNHYIKLKITAASLYWNFSILTFIDTSVLLNRIFNGCILKTLRQSLMHEIINFFFKITLQTARTL